MLVKYEKVEKTRVKTRSKPQARQEYDQAALLALADSLAAGQLQPIGLLSDYTLIWGERRLRAALLKQEITHLWAAVFDQEVTESQFLLMRATENFQRADLTAYEKWLTCKELLEVNPQWHMKELAERLHFDPSMVTRLLSPSKCIQAWQDALKDGTVGISDCYAASKLDAVGQSNLLSVKLSGASRDAIEHAGRKSRAMATPSVKLSRVKIAMPHGATVAITGKDLTISAVVELLGETLKEARKAAGQYDVKTFQSMMRDKARAK